MSGKIENFHHPRRTNKPRDRVGSTEWLVENQRTTAGAIVVSTPRASGTITTCTKRNWMHFVTRFSLLSTSSDHFSSAQWEEARPWRRSSRWWRRWSARDTIKHEKTCFGASFSTELSQYHWWAHETTLIWCRKLRATRGYNFDAITLNISKVMT